MRVIELSGFVAAPLGGMTLAQLGADVIRVDQVGGGPDIDRWPLAPSGRSLYWAGLNKGKRSVTVDLRSPDGRRLVAALAAESGVVLTNAPQREGLTYEALREARPDLIHVRLQGRQDGGNAVDYLERALDADFRRARDRYAYREALGGVLAPWFASRTCEQAGDALDGTSVLWSRYRDFAEVAAGLDAEPLMAPLDQPGVGPHLAPGSPLRFGGTSQPPSPAPTLGEHTDEVLRDVLSLPPERIEELRTSGAIGGL